MTGSEQRVIGLGERAWPELVDVGARPHTLLVPIGSTEQHGPHLPLDTDTRIATAVAHRAAVDPALWVAPPVPYGAAGEHESFPGTVSIGHDALSLLLLELGRSAGRWAHRILLVNGHGGNISTLTRVVGQLRTEGRDVAWFACGVPGGDAHAGRTETSLMLAIAPELVRLDLAVPGNTAALEVLMPALRAGGVGSVSVNGVLGDPSGASGEEGERLSADLVHRLGSAVRAWQVGAGGRISP